ncbi:hypothetical protein TNCV_2133851 [Trichonephila clavipes]|nr:hypothetical protein TNCV_2133851 [Trichonephila clavipes]
MWFQHDGAPVHISAQMCEVLWIQHIQSDGLGEVVRPIDTYENLVARIAVVAGEIREIPGGFANVRHSLRRRCEACIFAGGRFFQQFL